ncbi:peptide deformylase [Arcobacter sp. FWKO B]|uniref:peptide deformylase n=1 Tax=Arcobacter sp. FWKO B TaxID=2593672 RepID=UPI0018A450E8|nr:peptide deformylase [Arcobacter sp. FWKO B]QOG12041.1 peptide deformylase [Arcobacter sp. FWKO B]
MIREIVTYPNKILRSVSSDVEKFDEELHTLLDDMWDTMIAYNGVGLAAIQVGVALNVLIISLPDVNDEQRKEDLIEAINPKITHKDGELSFSEGCLSVPNFHEEVKRSEHIIVEYYDRNGTHKSMECHGFLAVAWQHEMDHLKGHLFIEKLSIIKRKKFEKEYKKEQKHKK